MKEILKKLVNLREHGRINDSDIAALLRGERHLVTSRGTGSVVSSTALATVADSVVSFTATNITGLVAIPAADAGLAGLAAYPADNAGLAADPDTL